MKPWLDITWGALGTAAGIALGVIGCLERAPLVVILAGAAVWFALDQLGRGINTRRDVVSRGRE